MDTNPDGLFGGLQVSLDMEQAFDMVRRDIVLQALSMFDLQPDVLHMIQIWLAPHKYPTNIQYGLRPTDDVHR